MSGNRVEQPTPAAGTCKTHNQEPKGRADKINQKGGFFWSYGRYNNANAYNQNNPSTYTFFWDICHKY